MTTSDGTLSNTPLAQIRLKIDGTLLASFLGYSKEQITPSIFIFATPSGATPIPPSSNDPATSGVTTTVNTLTGDAGGNTLNGGTGVQTMEGRTGDDTYIVDDTGDTVNELPGGGYDAVESSITYTLANNVEQLTLTGTSVIDGTGNADANRIIGNSGNNKLNGKGGSDDLLGGKGNDSYVVDVGTDRITEQNNEGSDGVWSFVSYLLGNNLEYLILAGSDAINATGNELNNRLFGNKANNILDGGPGSDSMTGKVGDDSYFVDNSGDVITEETDEGIDTVHSTVNYTLADNVENLILGITATTGTGNALDNQIIGNDTANTLAGDAGNDWLDGGLGSDSLLGGLGDDIYVINNIGDVVTETSTLATEIDSVSSSITYTLSSNVENLTLTGTVAINGTGNALKNILIGNSAANKLNGATGNDVLTGGAGKDIFQLTTLSNDTIKDFSVIDDTIQFENSVFAKLTVTGVLNAANFKIATAATDANDYIVYNSSTGALLYDADGNGAGNTVQIAVLGANLALTNADFVVI